MSVESSSTLVDLFGATLGAPSLPAVPMKHCWLPIMSFMSCVSTGMSLPPSAARSLRRTAIRVVHGKPHISWPHCIFHGLAMADRDRSVTTHPFQADKLLGMRRTRSNDDAMQTDARDRDRRRWRLYFVRTDRRSGFDRRLPSTWSGRFLHRVLVRLRDDDRTLFALLAVANVLNILDFLLTLRALAHGAEAVSYTHLTL